jgi:hypothetical protein
VLFSRVLCFVFIVPPPLAIHSSSISWCYSVLCSVRSFYQQRSAGLETEDSSGTMADDTPPTSALVTHAAPGAGRSSVSHRDATWRAGFALRVYEVMLQQPEDYALVSSSMPRSKQ